MIREIWRKQKMVDGNFKIVYLMFVLVSLALAGTAVADDPYVPPNRMVILDFSGSMSEQYYPDARDVALQLTESAQTVDPSAKTGLVVFGHTLGGIWGTTPYSLEQHCADVKIEFDYGELNLGRKSTLAEASQRIRDARPSGDTPVLKSIELAAAQLSSDGGSVILVTDLDEVMCSNPPDNDPCYYLEDLVARYAKKNIYITHVIAVPTTNIKGARRLADCSGAKFIQMGLGPNAVNKVVSTVNDHLKDAVQPAIVDIKINYLSTPTLTPKNGSNAASVKVVDSSRFQRNYGFKTLTSKPVRPGLTSVSVELGDYFNSLLVDVIRGGANSVEFDIDTTEVVLILIGPNGDPVPQDIPVKWIFTGAGDRRVENGSSEITISALPFTHAVEVSYPGYEGGASFSPFNGQKRLTRSIELEPIKPLEGQGEYGVVDISVDYSASALFSPAHGEISLLMVPAIGDTTAIPLDGIQPTEIGEGDYNFFLDTTAAKIRLGKISVYAGTRVDVSGSLPSTVLEVNTTPEVSKQAVWTLVRGSSELHFQGNIFRHEVFPGNYRIRVTDEGKVGEAEIPLPASGGVVSHTINL